MSRKFVEMLQTEFGTLDAQTLTFGKLKNLNVSPICRRMMLDDYLSYNASFLDTDDAVAIAASIAIERNYDLSLSSNQALLPLLAKELVMHYSNDLVSIVREGARAVLNDIDDAIDRMFGQ